MAVAFAGIANNGVTCTPIAIDRIVGRDGEEIAPPEVDLHAVGAARGRRGDAHRMGAVMTRGTAQASYAGDRAIGAADRQDRYHRRREGHLDGRGEHEGGDRRRGRQRQRRREPARYLLRSGQAATARHRMWPEVMSVASAKYGGDPFTEAGLAP